MTPRLKVLLVASLILCVLGAVFLLKREPRKPVAAPVAAAADEDAPIPAGDGTEPTLLFAHNLRLRQGSVFRVYVRWISGKMVRTRKNENPSFDDPESFVLEIDKGVARVAIQDVVDFLNSGPENDSPLKNVSIEADGDTLKVHGTVHKIVPLPVMISGKLTPEPDGRVRLHVAKIDVLKIPLKGLLGGFHVELADLVKPKLAGISIVDNDIFFDTQKLLPAPHIRGVMTSLKVVAPDIQVVYGNAPADDAKLAQWHNFLRLRGGTLDFGKLTMKHADLTMIDAAQEPWFDLDLVNYQAQLVQGYSRMTPQAGLEIYMPAAGDKKAAAEVQAVSLEWLKNRNTSLPADVPKK